MFVPASMESPVGDYNIEADNIVNAYVIRDMMLDIVPIVSGTFSIVPTYTYPPYSVHVNLMTDDGERIEGSYTKGDMYGGVQ